MFKCKIELKHFAFKIKWTGERPEGEMRRKWVKQRGQGREGKLNGGEKEREQVLGKGEDRECGMGLVEGRIA